MRYIFCPICVVVSGSWLLLQLLVLMDFVALSEVKTLIALLMGASVVGIAYQGGRKIPVILIGLPLAYLLLFQLSWLVWFIELVILVAAAYSRFILPAEGSRVKDIEKKLEQCCDHED